MGSHGEFGGMELLRAWAVMGYAKGRVQSMLVLLWPDTVLRRVREMALFCRHKVKVGGIDCVLGAE